jgi:hypothetical protein
VVSAAERAFARLASACARPFVACNDPAAWSESHSVSHLLDSIKPTATRRKVPPRPPLFPLSDPTLLGQWVSQVCRFSSQYGEASWSANNICGEPRAFLRGHGDFPQAWAPASIGSRSEFIELAFAKPVYPLEIQVFESFNPGAIVVASIWDSSRNDWHAVYTCVSQCGTIHTCRKLDIQIPHEARTMLSNLVRLEIDQNNITSWYEIDAVRLVGKATNL